MSNLRVVGTTESSVPESIFKDRILQVAQEAIAAGALTVLVLWEAPDGSMPIRCIPDTLNLQRGYAIRLGDEVFDEDENKKED